MPDMSDGRDARTDNPPEARIGWDDRAAVAPRPMGALMVLTENYAWGGAAVYLRELILAVRPLYQRIILVSNRGGLEFGDLPETILATEWVEYVQVPHLTEAHIWSALRGISGKLALAARWLFRRVNAQLDIAVCSRLLRKHKPDAVFCANHGYQDLMWAMMSVCGKRDLPTATYLLGTPDAFENSKPDAQMELDAGMWAAARFAIVNAAAVGDAHGRARGLPSGKVVVVPNGIPDDSARHRRRRGCERLRVGTLGRLAVKKGVHHLIGATCQLRASGLALELVIAGEGTELEPLQELAAELSISDIVDFAGFVPDCEVADFLAGLDVFVLASLTEGLPFSVMEAMRAGLPIVASSVGGLPEMLSHGESALLVDPGDEAALAHAIARLAADPDLADRLGLAARQCFVDRYTTTAMHEAIREAFVSGGMVPGACPDEPC